MNTPRPLRPGEKSQLNLTFHLEWCYTNRIRNSLFHITKAQHALMMLKLRVQPIHPWTIGQTAASSAFRLTSEVTANCPQQSEASSRNDAKELQLSLVFSIWHPFPHTSDSFPLSVSSRLLSRHSARTSWKFSLEELAFLRYFAYAGFRVRRPLVTRPLILYSNNHTISQMML